eukprot:305486-Chlamydomonas_euryale.AAC.2
MTTSSACHCGTTAAVQSFFHCATAYSSVRKRFSLCATAYLVCNRWPDSARQLTQDLVHGGLCNNFGLPKVAKV